MPSPPRRSGPQLLDDALLDRVVGGSSAGPDALANGAMGVGFSQRGLAGDLMPNIPPPVEDHDTPEDAGEEDPGGVFVSGDEPPPGGDGGGGGVQVGGGDLDGDGQQDVFGSSGGSQDEDDDQGQGDGPRGGGVQVATGDLDGDGQPDVVTGGGENGAPEPGPTVGGVFVG